MRHASPGSYIKLVQPLSHPICILLDPCIMGVLTQWLQTALKIHEFACCTSHLSASLSLLLTLCHSLNHPSLIFFFLKIVLLLRFYLNLTDHWRCFWQNRWELFDSLLHWYRNLGLIHIEPSIIWDLQKASAPGILANNRPSAFDLPGLTGLHVKGAYFQLLLICSILSFHFKNGTSYSTFSFLLVIFWKVYKLFVYNYIWSGEISINILQISMNQPLVQVCKY